MKNIRQLPIRREVSRKQKAIAIGLMVFVAVSLFSMIFLFVLIPQSIPVSPPGEWTIIAESKREQESEGWEQAAKVYQGIRDNILFFRVVWNESRQNLQGIFWKDSYEQTFNGTEGLVEMNSSYVETRYVYIIMKSPSHAHEIVIMQLPQTPAEVPFLYNVKKVYKAGDDFTATVGIIPTENNQVLPINVQDLQVQEVQTGVTLSSSFRFYLSENLPSAMEKPIINGSSEDWLNLAKFEVQVKNVNSTALLACKKLSLSRYDTTVSIMFSLFGNYSWALQRFPNATIQTLSQLLFYSHVDNRQQSYSLYLHADRENGILEVNSSIFHAWDEKDGTYYYRYYLPNSTFAVDNSFEAELPASVWEDLYTESNPIHVTPSLDFAYSWNMQLIS